MTVVVPPRSLSTLTEPRKCCQPVPSPSPPPALSDPEMLSGHKRADVWSIKRGITESPWVAASHAKNRDPQAYGMTEAGHLGVLKLTSPGAGQRSAATLAVKSCL